MLLEKERKLTDKNQIIAFVLAVLITVLLVFQVGTSSKISDDNPINEESFYSDNGNAMALQLGNGDSIVQELAPKGTVLTDFSLVFGTNRRVNKGNLEVALYENEELIQKWGQKSSELEDNVLELYSLDTPLRIKEGNTYYISVTYVYSESNTIALWMNKDNEKDCYVNGKLSKWDMGHVLTYRNDKIVLPRAFVIFAAILLIVSVLCCFGFRRIAKEKVIAFQKKANSFCKTGIVGVISVVLIFALLQTAFFPYKATETDDVTYVLSYLAVCVHLAILVFSLVGGCKKFSGAYTAAMAVGAVGYCVGRFVSNWETLYNGVCYLTFLVSAFVFVRIAYNFSIKQGLSAIKKLVVSNWRNLLVCVIAVIIAVLFVFMIRTPAKVSDDNPINEKSSANGNAVALQMSNGDNVVQELVPSSTVLTDFSIVFGTNKQVNEGALKVALYENEELIQEWRRNSAELVDNALELFSLDAPLNIDEENTYYISVTYICSKGNAIAIWMNADNEKDCYINGKSSHLDMGHVLTYQNTKMVLPSFFVICAAVLLTISVLCFFGFRHIAEEKVTAFQKMVNSLFKTGIVGIIFAVLIFKLLQIAFFPYKAAGTDAITRFVSYFAVGAHLVIVVLSLLGGCKKFKKAYISAVVIGAIGFFAGRFLSNWEVLYKGVCYLTFLVSAFVFVRIACDFSIKRGLAAIKDFVVSDWRNLAACVIAVVITVVFVFLVSTPAKVSDDNPIKGESAANGNAKAIQLNNGDRIVQELTPNDTVLTDFSIVFGTYRRVNEGTLKVALYENEELIQEWRRDSSELVDNALELFSLDTPLHIDEDNSYYVSVMYVYRGRNAIAIWMNADNEKDCYVNGKLSHLDMGHVLTYQNNKMVLPGSFVNFVVALLTVSVLCCFGFRYIAEEKIIAFRKMANSFFKAGSVGIISVILILKLLQTVFFPYKVTGTDSVTYFASYFAVGVHLSIVLLAFVGGCKKFSKAYTSAMVVSAIGYCVGSFVRNWGVLYSVVYYLAILLSVFVFVRTAYDFSVKQGLAVIKKFVVSNWINILACILAVAAGAGVEIVRAYTKGLSFLWMRSVFFSAILLCITECVFLYCKKEKFVERATLCILLTIGISFAVLLPFTTFITWDDQIHYQNTLLLVQGPNWTDADRSLSNFELGVLGPHMSVSQLTGYFNSLAERGKVVPAEKYTLGAGVQPLQCTGYIPRCIGMWVGHILNLPYGYTFLAGRVSSAIIYAFVIYAAMKRLSSGKMLIAAVALLPTNFFQACNYTYDSWIVSLVIYAVAFYVGYLQRSEKRITVKEYLLMAFVLALAIAPKGIYFPLFALFLLMPKEIFSGKKQYYRYILAIIGSAFACFFILMLLPFMGGAYATDVRFGSEVSSSGQIWYILTHPLTYLNVLLNYLKEYLSAGKSSEYTVYMAYMGKEGNVIAHWVILIVVALVDRCVEDRRYNTVVFKIGSSLVFLLTAAAIATIMYCVCSPVGSNVIAGCQARYLSPLLFPLLIFGFNFGRFELKNRERFSALVLIACGYFCLVSIWGNVIERYIM